MLVVKMRPTSDRWLFVFLKIIVDEAKDER